MPRSPRRSVPLLTAAAAVAVVGLLAGCGGSSPAAPSAKGDPAYVPVTVDNCGTSVTFTAAPRRIVTVKSSVTELAIALGAADRIVGTAFLDGPFAPDYAAAGAGLPSLADKVPSGEVVLGATPDLVWAGWESVFAPDAVGDRTRLAGLGVRTYVAPSACKEAAYKPDPLTSTELFREITEAGAILGAPRRAADLVASQRAALAAVTPSDKGLSALWFSSGSDTPYVGAGIGAPQLMMDAVGLRNIAADVKDTWAPFGWEQVVADDPDVIVLVDASWSTKEKKIGVLESNPATAKLSAVVHHRYLVVPFADTEAGVRTVPAIADLAAQLAALPAP